jgi:hypothetical protein
VGELQPDAAEIERHIAVFEQGRPAYPERGKPPPVGVRRRRTFAEPRHAPCLWSVASEQPASAARARLRLPGAVAHEQPAATSSVIVFTRRVHGRVHPRKLAAVRVRRDVHCFEELF